MNDIIIGIDLGTTNSEVAVARNGRVQLIEVEDAYLMPSAVGLDEHGALLVGQAARNQLALHPERTVRSIKRRMGEDIKIPLGDRSYTPQEISAVILARLKQAAEVQLGEPVRKAVITVPAYFSDAQRQATRDAGTLAGLDVVRIINEPTAAALAYEGDQPERRHILVYDLGGGTFDVSVVRMEQDVVEVLASHGNNHLGGDDFDALIVDQLRAHVKDDHGVDPADDPRAMARLRHAAEAAKMDLSGTPIARIEEAYLLEGRQGPINLSVDLTRADYEEMIEPLLDETLEAVRIALEDAELAVNDLDEIVLVGGTTRTPRIQQRLEELLGVQPRGEIDPDLCVAMGAAIQGAVIAGEQVASMLVDVTPYTFGTSAIAELNGERYPYCFIPVIRKNTPIPVTRSEAFFTSYDGQEAIDVRVFQGEDPDALNNTQIGSFRIEGLSDVPAGNVIITTFSLDVNGILHVSSVEKLTGKRKEITIDSATARFEREEMGAARERVQDLIDSDAESPGRQAVADSPGNRTAELIERAERLLDQANPEDREDLVDAIEQLRDALEQEDAAAIEQAREALSDLVFYLES
ncbi:MAG: Hsp70 family protein [Halorhodospira halophila]|uniref:Hsp70 family protein n=1 Tax=Halorhodospira TaxID=85108 RepID=UPI001EE8E81C|nr:Hsp70 family protein [Halorhodospira halophila]MCC3750623.1 Hsp70 family protein [Halorhodospira halophila]MCG5538317.1 Hsp70 family protein [Halorhodospira sp. 9622]MCG5540085.1 Hsp70 family protein [Halorhodospira sp. M39old]MCG5544893.1 Hsp70 family protein [Halorhodospira sp. M38]